MGFTHFRWNAIMDAKVREEHAHLNGTIWAFDDPPEIDEHTHQKGLPGETYNCRCGMTPINPNSQFTGVL
jgi:SPP1 gp7 family putative phage head morphogenesis protein